MLKEVDCDCGWSGEVMADVEIINKVVFVAVDVICPNCKADISYRSNSDLSEWHAN